MNRNISFLCLVKTLFNQLDNACSKCKITSFSQLEFPPNKWFFSWHWIAFDLCIVNVSWNFFHHWLMFQSLHSYFLSKSSVVCVYVSICLSSIIIQTESAINDAEFSSALNAFEPFICLKNVDHTIASSSVYLDDWERDECTCFIQVVYT